jgi:hypothetical protein
MKQNVLLLALAVLPAATSATYTKHCYFKFKCQKDITGATGFAGTAGATKLSCDASTSSTYLATADAKGYQAFAPKGGALGEGTAACLADFEAADIPSATATASAPVGIVGEVYTNSDCSTKLCDGDNQCKGNDTLAAIGVDIGAAGTTVYTGTAETTHAKLSALYLPANTLSDVSTVGPITGDLLQGVGIASRALPTLAKAAFVASDAGAGGCSAFQEKAYINVDAFASQTAATTHAYYTATANQKSATSHNAKDNNTVTAAVAAADRAFSPTGVSAECTVDGVEFTYHKTAATKACGAVHTAGWQPQNAALGKIKCLPLNNVLHARCTGTNKCADAVNAVLAKLTADAALGTLEKCKDGSGATGADNANTQCSKACQCIDPDNSKFLNWAWATASANAASFGDCWLSGSQPGVLEIDIFGQNAVVAAPASGVTYGRAAKGALLALNHAKQTSVGGSTCGALAKTKAAALAATPATAVADPDNSNDEFSSVWSKTGCGHTVTPPSSGANSALASTVTSVLVLIAGAALL